MLVEKARILDQSAMGRAIARISFEIVERNKGVDNLCRVGIMNGGVDIAHRIARKIGEIEGKPVEVGKLDITPCRDDGSKSTQDRSDIPFAIEGKRVVLVDDVIYTGRSVRAAIDALMSRGRPQSIQLAALVDRGHRELPLRPDYIGKNVPTSSHEVVQVKTIERDGVDAVTICAPSEEVDV